jgi:hypothetical protein
MASSRTTEHLGYQPEPGERQLIIFPVSKMVRSDWLEVIHDSNGSRVCTRVLRSVRRKASSATSTTTNTGVFHNEPWRRLLG